MLSVGDIVNYRGQKRKIQEIVNEDVVVLDGNELTWASELCTFCEGDEVIVTAQIPGVDIHVLYKIKECFKDNCKLTGNIIVPYDHLVENGDLTEEQASSIKGTTCILGNTQIIPGNFVTHCSMIQLYRVIPCTFKVGDLAVVKNSGRLVKIKERRQYDTGTIVCIVYAAECDNFNVAESDLRKLPEWARRYNELYCRNC